MEKNISLSIVIPTYKRPQAFMECLRSILDQSELPAEIFCIDDDSLNENIILESDILCRKRGIRFYYVKKDHAICRKGLSESKNLALDLVSSDIVLFLDDDIVLDAGFLVAIMNCWRSDSSPLFFSVGGIVREGRARSVFELMYHKFFGIHSTLAWDVNDVGYQIWDDSIKHKEKGYYSHGGLTSYRTNLVREFRFCLFQGGRTGLEDVELSLRTKKCGYYSWMEPRATALHHHASLGRESEWISGKKESQNRKVIFKTLCKQDLFHQMWFFWASVGWVLRQFINRNLKKGFGMIEGFFPSQEGNQVLHASELERSVLQKKKILVTMPWSTYGAVGTERSMSIVLNHFSKELYEISVIILTANSVDQVMLRSLVGPECEIQIFSTVNPFSAILRLAKQIKKRNPDFLIANTTGVMCLTILAKWFSTQKAKMISLNRGMNFRDWKRRFLNQFAYFFSDAYVVVSQGMKQTCMQELSVLGKKIRPIYNSFDIESILKQSEEPLEPEDLAYLSKIVGPRVLYIGRFEEIQKEVSLLVKAVALLCNQGRFVHLILVGDGPDKSLLFDLVETLHVQEYVHFFSWKKNPYPYIKSSDVLVLSSAYEGFGRVIVEALALGVQVVSTDCPSGPSEILDRGTYGRLVPIHDDVEFAKAILLALDHPIDPNKLKMRARDFSYVKAVSDFEELFLELDSNPKRPL